MEAIRGYLPKFQIPSLAQLRDGSFLSKAVKKYEDEAHHSVIRDFEVSRGFYNDLHCHSLTEQTDPRPGGRGLVQPHRECSLGGCVPDDPLLLV